MGGRFEAPPNPQGGDAAARLDGSSRETLGDSLGGARVRPDRPSVERPPPRRSGSAATVAAGDGILMIRKGRGETDPTTW